jgi:hypothetical protein
VSRDTGAGEDECEEKRAHQMATTSR